MTFEQWWSEYAIQNEISKELLPAFKAVAKDAWENLVVTLFRAKKLLGTL